jgi:hypothetical protein
MTDSGSINLWLALIAIASIIQSAILVGAVYFAWRASREAKQMVERFERQQLNPLLGHVHEAVTDVREVVARARALEGEVRDKVRVTSAQVASRLWPAIALGRAARAVYGSLTHPEPAQARSTTFDSTRR